MHSKIINQFKSKKVVIGIVGLGYVGLPLMLRYNEVGFKVLGFDIDQSKVDMLMQGKSYIEHISTEAIKNAVDTGFEG